MTKPVTYSDIISDESVLSFLSDLRSFNGLQAGVPEIRVKSMTNNSGPGGRFASVVRAKERNASAKECILCALNSYDALVAQGETEKAGWEISKIVDIILQTYQTSESSRLYDCLSRQDITLALQGVLDIYNHVVHGPQRQYQPDNRTVTTSLV